MELQGKTIVLVLHGYAMKPSQYHSLKSTIVNALPGSDVLVPRMPLSVFACIEPNHIIRDLLGLLQQKWDELTPEVQQSLKIIVIGHSTGAVMARKLYIAACGENADAPFEKSLSGNEQKPWAKNIERIILFAGINKGWTLSSNMPFTEGLKLKTAITIGKLMQLFNCYPVAFRTRRGDPYITQLRIQALSMKRHAEEKGVGNALTIQLLGTQDPLVSPDDNIDLSTGHQFVYLEIPASDHRNVIDMSGEYGQRRQVKVKDALTLTMEQLHEMEIIPADQMLQPPDESVTDVVFVIHGIRDTGYWTQKIARKVKSMGDKLEGRKFAIETSSYGYFPMLHFLLYGSRQAKVSWFMDQYIENLSRYPNARFSFIGHSNGTYLLSKALSDYPASAFKNVVLAGSVIPSHFRWQDYVDQKRVENVYNFVATNDWVVGIFPKTFQTLRFQDLGSGGYDGFNMLSDTAQFKWIPGNHGAAIEEYAWDELAYIAIHGKTSCETALPRSERKRLIKVLTWAGPFLFFGSIGVIVMAAVVIYMLTQNEPYLLVLALLAYVAIVHWFVTKY